MKIDLDQTTADIVVKLGKQYEWAPLPDDIKKGPTGMCFDWSALQTARLHPKYRYVEGIAKSVFDNDWKLHAWLTDGTHAFDPTWMVIGDQKHLKGVPPFHYIGIEIDIHTVHKFMKLTGYQGILGLSYQKYPGATSAT
jgi:hypothetical protein